MVAAVYFAGDSGFLHSVHQIEKRDHGRAEEEKASSPKAFLRLEMAQRGAAAHGGGYLPRRDRAQGG